MKLNIHKGESGINLEATTNELLILFMVVLYSIDPQVFEIFIKGLRAILPFMMR
ncbi:MAG: hypothetical protein ACLTUR_06645 [Paraclostridium sordellii]